jgi:serine/threonine-protein kinase
MIPARRGDDQESLVGTTIAGKYFVHQLLGRGGMGNVYKATLLGPDRPIALKLLAKASRSDPTLARRFEREATAASRLHHPNAIEVVDFGESNDGSLYLAMEFVPGRTLAQVISENAPLPAARAVHLLAQVLEALGDAHANGVIHRDLKPANVMIDPLRNAAGFVKVLDFGIATLADADAEARLTGRDVVYGTPAYMSPEQIRGEPLDARSDLYSAGVMLFEMLSGVLPFEAPRRWGSRRST